MTQGSEIVKVHCNRCIRDTNHEVIAKRQHSYGGEDSHFSEHFTYEMLECRGCCNVTLRETYNCSAEKGSEVTFYPPPVSRRKPDWMFRLMMIWPELDSLIREVYTALHSGSLRLALLGARTVIDLVLQEKVSDIGRFDQKIAECEKLGHITRNEGEYLKAAIDAGNAAAHRAYEPDAQAVNQVMDIVEHLIQSVYILKGSTVHLKDVVPPRPKRAKPSHSGPAVT